MAEKKGFMSAFLPATAKKSKDEKEDFLKDVKSEVKQKKGQEKISYMVDQIKSDENGQIRIELKEILAENFQDSTEISYHLVYDSFSEGLEPVYFWIVDFMRSMGYKVDKTKEDFYASVGSAFYGELGQRATKMQEQAMKMLGTMNTIIRSMINLLYDLKEFEIRLKPYDILASKYESGNYGSYKTYTDAQARAELELKQVWMDQVDIKRGLGSINNMAQQLQFVTLRDAYMMIKDVKDLDEKDENGNPKVDLNERVIRILKIKLEEYNSWKEYSEKELRKRYEIEKSYLKSQVASLKIYAKWTKPYLLAAKKLDMKVADMSTADIVSVFNNMEISLELTGTKSIDIQKLIDSKDLPEDAKVNDSYNEYVTAELKFRSVPHSVQTPQGYQYRQGGRVDIYLRAYGLSDTEIKEIKASQEDDELKLVNEMLNGILEPIKEDLEKLAIEEKKEPEKKEEREEGPISALFSGFREITSPLKHIKFTSENYFDIFVKDFAKEKVKGSVYTVYDVYKKAHGMMSL